MAVRGHDPRLLSQDTDRLILAAMTLAGAKVLTHDENRVYAEIPLDDSSRGVQGTRCYMDLERIAPTLLERLCPAAAKLEGLARVNLYVSPQGYGTPLHFDSRDVCIVQLFGGKTWWVAEEVAVESPTENCVFPDGATMVNYGGQELARPVGMTRIELIPGDWLRVPRGVWHRTATTVGSVSASVAGAARD